MTPTFLLGCLLNINVFLLLIVASVSLFLVQKIAVVLEATRMPEQHAVARDLGAALLGMLRAPTDLGHCKSISIAGGGGGTCQRKDFGLRKVVPSPGTGALPLEFLA